MEENTTTTTATTTPTSSLPILEPISYRAQTERTFGKRFVTRIQTGLQVVGESNDDGIVVHAGKVQLQVLGELVNLLLQSQQQLQQGNSDETSSIATNTGISTNGQFVNSKHGKSSIFLDEEDAEAEQEETKSGDHENKKDYDANGDFSNDDDVEPPSLFQLPLAGISLVLPNNTKLSIADLMLRYKMDGSLFTMESNSGFWVDDHFPFFALGETCLWRTDLVHQQISILDMTTATAEHEKLNKENQDQKQPQPPQEEEIVAFIHAQSTRMNQVIEGLTMALDIYQSLNVSPTTTISTSPSSFVSDKSSMGSSGSSSSAWSLEVFRTIGFLWEEGSQDVALKLRNVKAKAITAETQNSKGQLTNNTSIQCSAKLDQFYIPGKITLTSPIENMDINFDGSTLKWDISDDVYMMLQEEDELATVTELERTVSSSSADYAASNAEMNYNHNQMSPFVMPFGATLSVNKLCIFKTDGESIHTLLDGIVITADPVHDHDQSNGHVQVNVIIEEINHDMIRLKKPYLYGIFHSIDVFDTIDSFLFQAEEIHVASGYSIKDWISIIPIPKIPVSSDKDSQASRKILKEEKPVSILLPYAQINKLKIIILVKSKLVGLKESVLYIDPLDGKKQTTTDDVIHYYSARVVSKVPGMIGNAQVLGNDVSETVVSHYGGAILGGLVGASASVGGIVSVAAFEGLRNTIKEGKRSRGVKESDKSQLTDLIRGMKYAAVRATREGAKKRGKTEDQGGDPIDWAIGATSDFVNYGNENKARLGGVGAGALGFAYGFALGGPVGAVAGAIAASATAKKTIEVVDDVGIGAKTKIKDQSSENGANYSVPVIHDMNLFYSNSSGRAARLPPKCRFAGLLRKRRDFVVWDFRAHFFVLENNSLKYYALIQPPADATNTDGKLYIDSSAGPRKTLLLSDHFVEINNGLSRPKANVFVFTINSYEQRDPLWVLVAQTDEIRQKWVDQIREVCSRGDNGMKPKVLAPQSKTSAV